MQNTDNQKAVVSLLHQSFLDATLAKREAFMPENLHPDFVFTSPKAVLLNKEDFIQKLVINPGVQLEVFGMKAEEKITITENTAVLHGIIAAKFKDQDERLLRITTTLVYENAGWKLLAMQETYMP